MLTIDYNGKRYANHTAQQLRDANVPADAIGAAAKAQAIVRAETIANAYRARLASRSPAKLMEYRLKEEIARDPAAVPQEELDLIDAEAAARGLDRDGLLALILQKASALRRVSLRIAVLEAEAKAAVEAVDETAADVEDQLDAALTDASALAETAFAEALTILGGS